MSAERDEVDDFLELAGRGFDSEANVLAGDEQRVERIERAVQKRYAVRPMPRPRRLVVVTGSLFAAGVAFAGWRGLGTHTETKPAASAAPSKSVTAVPVAAPSALPSVVAVAPSAPSVRSLPAAQPASSVVPDAAARVNTLPAAEPLADLDATAATLFAAANSARVAGDTVRAVALSQQLLARFPRSAEASSTHLSLGMLRLQRGQAAQALAEFQAYEAQGAGEALAEALWGKAQALRVLGRREEEKATLNELVRKFPRAAYAPAAQKRLAALP